MSTSPPLFRVPRDPVVSLRHLAIRELSPLAWCPLGKTGAHFFWARNAIYHSLRALGVAPGDSVLVPAYVCSAAVEPIEAYGAKVDFFEVLIDCTPDLRDLELRIGGRVRAILLVHYFGFPGPVVQLRQFCDRHRLCLIEDCAHVLSGHVAGAPLGSFGDASVFSWRKFLPVFDGATLIFKEPRRELQVAWRTESLVFTLRAAKHLLEPALQWSPRHAQPDPGPAPQAVNQTPVPADWQSRRFDPLKVNNNSAAFEPEMVDFPMSRLSRLLLSHSDIEAITEIRNRNYRKLAGALASVDGVRLLHQELPDGVCPWVLPLFLEWTPQAHLRLRELGIPAATWGGVRHPRIPIGQYPSADHLYENLVFLPVHQSLLESDLNTIVGGVREVASSSSKTRALETERSSNMRSTGDSKAKRR